MTTEIKLQSSDGEIFIVDEAVANMSQTVKNYMEENGGADDPIPLPNVNSKVLAKVIVFCKYHLEAIKKIDGNKPAKTDEEVRAWRQEFYTVDVNHRMLFDLVIAANYLNIKPMLDRSVEAVAAEIKGLSPTQMREKFADILPKKAPEMVAERAPET